MLKLCKNHSKSFKVPFGGARKKERKRKRSDFFFLFCVRSLLPSLTFLSLFLSVSSRLNHHSLSFHSVSPHHHHHHHYPLVHFLTSSPHFNPFLSLSLSLTLCIFFYCFPLNYGNQLKLRGLLLKALEFDYYNHI